MARGHVENVGAARKINDARRYGCADGSTVDVDGVVAIVAENAAAYGGVATDRYCVVAGLSIDIQFDCGIAADADLVVAGPGIHGLDVASPYGNGITALTPRDDTDDWLAEKNAFLDLEDTDRYQVVTNATGHIADLCAAAGYHDTVDTISKIDVVDAAGLDDNGVIARPGVEIGVDIWGERIARQIPIGHLEPVVAAKEFEGPLCRLQGCRCR
ncbi:MULTISPECIES: hypothetical protein [unclassified Mesorhizobium]|uniref:hypothetical protein n=1 Tax=unclassified Mesorhizobium TaxID=325217 RepID=UPI0019D05295|nr:MULTISPECIES: hypothetical protein [unclassified Mesorhizobium]